MYCLFMKKGALISWFFLFWFLLEGCSTSPVSPLESSYPVIPDNSTPSEIPNNSPKFFTKSKLSFVKKATSDANCIILLQEFRSKFVERFDQTNDAPNDVYQKLISMTPIEIRPIRSKNPLTNMTATTFNNDPAIYLNSRKASRSAQLWAQSVGHEQTHKAGYTHEGNGQKGNEKTVPYLVGSYYFDLWEKCQAK